MVNLKKKINLRKNSDRRIARNHRVDLVKHGGKKVDLRKRN